VIVADTITIRTDAETEHALDVLTGVGGSRSAAIRQAVLEAARRRERATAMRRAVLRMPLGEPCWRSRHSEPLPATPPERSVGCRPVTVRTFDAIHLATALRLYPRPTSFITYDKRLAEAANHAGLTIDMPT
jgi:predicted nucleic acid-binding protein